MIKNVYIVHHSHTDLGYTDLQERVLEQQIDYVNAAIATCSAAGNEGFRWNCEAYFCVERFLEQADEAQTERFFELTRSGNLGVSASYLNFTDLVDAPILSQRTREMAALYASHGVAVKTAMIADINGISMGQRDALLDAGVEFFFTNIHTHHGMYPLYQNQTPYRWRARDGRELLVWNGEHYNLGNMLALVPPDACKKGGEPAWEAAVSAFHDNLTAYLSECEAADYAHDFTVMGVSGVFSDNAPPNDGIERMVQRHNALYGQDVHLRMVSLQELYALIGDTLRAAPVYEGDLNDWWAHGIGSTPYGVKHYREAQKMYHLAGRLYPEVYEKHPALTREAQDNLLVYAEHTWGHSATITNPYETMVTNLDMRKHAYASGAHEAAALLYTAAQKHHGDILRYYATDGKAQAVYTGRSAGLFPVEFYIETSTLKGLRVFDDATGREMTAQLSVHPRGALISFTDHFEPGETRTYRYEAAPAPSTKPNTRHAYVGSERVRDIVNTYDPTSYRLPYTLENEFLRLEYRIGEGFLSLYDKVQKRELLSADIDRFFTPLYECTTIRTTPYEERRRCGRNIRGQHAELFEGELTDVKVIDQGAVFTQLCFEFELEGTIGCRLFIKMFNDLPRLDVRLHLAKTLSFDVESVYLPLSLDMPATRDLYFTKGTVPFRPGVDQLPGTGMEYWASDLGAAYLDKTSSALICAPDVPLMYMGEMEHHAIELCDGARENNHRPLYSWIMNNVWETNFKMDLSGFGEFAYRLELLGAMDADAAFSRMEDAHYGVVTCLTQE